MPTKHDSQGGPPAEGYDDTPPSLSDEALARGDHGKLFADDGRKVRDTERVGAMAPDTDPPEDAARRRPSTSRPGPRRRFQIVP